MTQIIGTIASSKLKYAGNYGATWTDRGTVSTYSEGIIAYAGDKFFNIPSNTSGTTGYHSTDGITWTSFSLPNTTYNNVGIAGYAGNYVLLQSQQAGSGGAKFYMNYTTNLSTWTTTTITLASYDVWPKNIAYEPTMGKWMAVFYNQAAATVQPYYSSNGTTWTASNTQTGGNCLAWGLAAGAGYFLNAHYSDNKFYYTSDAITFTLGSSGGVPSAYHNGDSINPANGQYMWGSNTNNGGSNQPYWFWGTLSPWTRNSQYYGNTSLNGGNAAGWVYLGNGYWGSKFFSTTKTWAYTNDPATNTMTLVTGATIDALGYWANRAANLTGTIVSSIQGNGKVYTSP